MKRFVSLVLAVILVFIPTLTFAISWESIISSMTKSELLELQTLIETALSDFATVSPSATNTPRPIKVRNGTRYVYTDYKGTCPFEVKADKISNYYIYLEYQNSSRNSTTPRVKEKYASSPYEEDIAFFLEMGKSFEIDVPVGVYKLYYATGDSFYGSKLLFGDKTKYYASDDLLEFYCDGEYYIGNTVTLYSVANGNFDTEQIVENEFPGK